MTPISLGQPLSFFHTASFPGLTFHFPKDGGGTLTIRLLYLSLSPPSSIQSSSVEDMLALMMSCDVIVYHIVEDASQVDQASWAIQGPPTPTPTHITIHDRSSPHPQPFMSSYHPFLLRRCSSVSLLSLHGPAPSHWTRYPPSHTPHTLHTHSTHTSHTPRTLHTDHTLHTHLTHHTLHTFLLLRII